MPKKDLWIADPDPTAIVGSAGSCDSMISNDSSPSEMSDGGYDFLSVEEKECLMFLEETLDSLDTEADSGLSTDDSECAEPSKHPRTWPTRDIPKELDNENLGKHRKTEQKSKKSLSGSVPFVTPGCLSFPKVASISHVPQTSKASSVETASKAADPKALPQMHLTSGGPPKHGNVDMPNDQPNRSTQIKTSDLELVVIPPPEPFQDWEKGHSKERREPPLLSKDAENGTPYHSEVKKNTVVKDGYKTAQQQLSPEKMELGKEAILNPVSPKSSKRSEEIISAQDDYQKPTLEEATLDSNSKQGPPTAPKPRKLPPNIILKTSKSNAVSLNVDPSHKIKVLAPSNGRPRAATGDFSMERAHCLQKEQGKARREALEKLGLPLDKEKKTEEYMARNSAYPKPTDTPRTSSRESINVDDFTLNKKPDQPHDQIGEKGIHPSEINSPGIKQMNVKSNTLERSGVGLSSYISSTSEDQNVKNSGSLGKTSFFDKFTPNFLRSNRPRPASLGMGKDFTDLKENRMHSFEQEKNDKRRSYPLQNPSKLPRPSCVSVKITPKGATDENRREALKKLGLLKE
ncbi:specifically androgen-regulated gene protein isoform X2 [Hemicordylus capensis]|nr:specifically androgen-regulated gene protein isoform X2 [Hemicordylus capensis]XP_053105645.1 specifically androgen-regulated gene protein isoform X2 [Hemicordylus capensis]XP_053105647.1 specifically androgen-regulated gene protein isoform X2 [Hemicordylus capensis]